MPILTFVTATPQPNFDKNIRSFTNDLNVVDVIALDDRAIKCVVDGDVSKLKIDQMRDQFEGDIFYQTTDEPIKLFMADMDSTIVVGETLDDMADMVGIGEKIASITDRAMRGELDFEQAITERIGLLKDMSISVIDQALKAMDYNHGARELLTFLKEKDVTCVLVSGGFQQFTQAVADDLGFDQNFGNELLIENDQLTGDVRRPILDKNFKLSKLRELQQSMDISDAQIIAIGDGANDLPMLKAAGIGVAYHGKPLLKETLVNQINKTDLSSLRYLLD